MQRLDAHYVDNERRGGSQGFDDLRHRGRWSRWRRRFPIHLADRPRPDTRPRLRQSEGGWIGEHRRSFGDYAVGSLVPVVFDDYARIFHPAWSHARQPVRWDTVAAWSGRQMHPLAQWDDLSDPIAPLAQQQSFLEPPDSDGLPAAGLAALCGVLATHTATPDTCFVGLWEGYGWPNEQWAGREVLDLENRSFLVRRGPISIAQEVGWQVGDRSFHSQPPTITWPRDRAWIFVSDPDLDSTYLGGSRALVEVLLARPELEAWRVTQSDSISAGSDTINRRRPT